MFLLKSNRSVTMMKSKQANEQKYSWEGKYILMVQCSDDLTIELNKYFYDSGATFIYVDSILHVFTKFNGNLDKFDLLVVDFSLNPGFHSPLLTYIKTLNYNIPFLIMWMVHSPVMEKEMKRYGVTGFVKKPNNIEEMGKVIDKYLNAKIDSEEL